MTNFLDKISDPKYERVMFYGFLYLWITLLALAGLIYLLVPIFKKLGIIKIKTGNNEVNFGGKTKNDINNEIRMIITKTLNSAIDVVNFQMQCAANKIFAFGSILIENYARLMMALARYKNEKNIYAMAEMKIFKSIILIYCDRIKSMLLNEILTEGFICVNEKTIKTLIDNNIETYRMKFIEIVNENIIDEYCEVGVNEIIRIYENYYKVFEGVLISALTESSLKQTTNIENIELYINKFVDEDFQYAE